MFGRSGKKQKAPTPRKQPAPAPKPPPTPSQTKEYREYQNLLRSIERNLAIRNAAPGEQFMAPSKLRFNPGDFVDTRLPGTVYAQDMIDYIDPATGETASRTRGVVPGPNSRFIPISQYNQKNYAPMNNQAQAMQTYQNLFNQGAANYQAAMQQPLTPTPQPLTPAPQPIQPARKNISTDKRTPPIQAF